MKNFELEKIYNMMQKIPKEFPLDLKIEILRNSSIINEQHNILESLKKICSEDEIRKYMFMDFGKRDFVTFINILNLPDNINEYETDIVEGIFLLTNWEDIYEINKRRSI